MTGNNIFNLVIRIFLIIVVIVFIIVLFTGCRVKDVRTAAITAPAVTNETALAAVEASLRTLPGAEYLQILGCDFATGTITLRYDSMRAGLKNLEHAAALAGFACGPFPAGGDPPPKP